jgi:TetR/AcrR family transcriptional regulator, cholesterol catabolism regulator
MVEEEINEARERVLEAAESLFMERGYSAIKLKHISAKLGIKESSLYYHFPGGKETMYVEVMHRNLRRHREGIEHAIEQAGNNWVKQLRAVAYWLLSQTPVDVMRMHHSDLPTINAQAATELEDASYEALNLPIKRILERAVESGEAAVADADLLAGIFISMISAVHVIKPAWNPRTKHEMADILVDSWVNGLRRR